MSIGLMIYLAEVSGGLKGAMVFAAIIAFIVGSGALIHYASEQSDYEFWRKYEREKPKPVLNRALVKKAYFLALICALMATLLPTARTVYAIAAASYAQEIANKPGVQVLGDKVYQVLNQKLDEMIEDKKK